MMTDDDNIHYVDVPAQAGCVFLLCMLVTGFLLGALSMGMRR